MARISALVAFLWLALPLVVGSEESLAGNPRVADAIRLFDLWAPQQLGYHQIPGLSIGIVYDQELVWSRSYGVTDLETREPVTPASLFRIGSVTKLFTATAIMQLRDDGKLRLDDPVSEHLPWFAVQNPFPEAPAITIRHLLTHTGGLPREAAFPYWTEHEFPSTEEIVEALPTQTAIYPPEETYKYSNLGMALLGEVVAAVSGESYAEYISKNIFLPLGMQSSTVVPSDEHRDRMATAYMRLSSDGSRAVMEYYETRGMAPAANIVSSVEDMARFAALQLRPARPSDDQTSAASPVLANSTLREMQRAHWVYPSWTGGRGLGFGISRREGKTIVSHGGWIGGHRSHLLLVPEEQIAVIAMVNADDGSPSLFSYEALDVVGPAIAAATASPAVEPRKDPNWQRYLGLYTDPWGWEYEVLILNDRLVLYSHNYPPDDDADDGVTRLTPVDGTLEGTVFEMSDGETLVFEMDTDGNVGRIKRRYEYLYPVKP